MTTIFAKAQEYLSRDGTYAKRLQPDRLDLELQKFTQIVHNVLTGKAALELSNRYDERDPEFIEKYPSYTISKFLGRGQAGVVFLGEDDNGKPLFAIKIIHLPGAVGSGLPLRRTFLAYQDVLKHIQHENVNRYLGWTVVDNEAQVYTHFCNGGSLLDIIKDGQITEADVKRYLREILSGLEYLHSHGIVHRYV
jgi:serine/threonine protein kinase